MSLDNGLSSVGSRVCCVSREYPALSVELDVAFVEVVALRRDLLFDDLERAFTGVRGQSVSHEPNASDATLLAVEPQRCITASAWCGSEVVQLTNDIALLSFTIQLLEEARAKEKPSSVVVPPSRNNDAHERS